MPESSERSNRSQLRSSTRRPLALTATLATSAAAAAGLIAPVAHATTASPNGTANLTLSGYGYGGKTSSGTASIHGTEYALAVDAKIQDLSWAPTGARAAWIDPADNAVMAGIPGGAAQLIAPVPADGVKRSHPTWIDGGSRVVWSERPAGTNPATHKPYDSTLKTAYGDGLQTDGTGAPVVEELRAQAGVDLLHPDSVGSLLVYEAGSPSGNRIMVWNLAQPHSAPYAVAAGWSPSLSPDGSKVAFVSSTVASGSKTAAEHIFTVSTANPHGHLAAAHQVTGQPPASIIQNPVWTPDGSSLVFVAGGGTSGLNTVSVPATASATTSYAAIVPGTKVAGEPAFRPNVTAHVARIAGDDRLGTAIDASQSHWAAPGKPGAHAKAVVLSRSDQFADALGGSALAAKVGGPLLLTPPSGLDPAVRAEIARVLGPGDGSKTVYVLGGKQALSPGVAEALTTLHYKVERVAGDDRFGTAVAIAKEITGPDKAPDYILVATGEGFADPLSAGAAAGAINAHQGKDAVVLLTDDKVMPKATTDYLAPLLARTNLNANHSRPADFIELDSIGGQASAALGSRWIPPGYQAGSYLGLSGLDRYETSYFVARYFFGSAAAVGLATGGNWADALSGGAEMGTLDGPLLLVDPTGQVAPEVAGYLNRNDGQFTTVSIFGGTVAVPGSVDKGVGRLIAGIGGVDHPSNPKA